MSASCTIEPRLFFFFFQAEDGIRDKLVTGVQTCALPIFSKLVVERIRPQSLLRTCSTLNTSAVTSNDWPRTVLKTLARRALRKFIHGFRHGLRGSRVPRGSRRQSSPLM